MLTAVVTSSGSTVHVTLVEGILQAGVEGHLARETEEEHPVPENDLNPIFPEVKEVIWGFGSFVVLALAMRFFLFRKVRDGMDARYNSIQGDLEAGRGDDRAGARRRGRLRRRRSPPSAPRRSGRSKRPGRRSRPSAPPGSPRSTPASPRSVRPPRPRSRRPRRRPVRRSRPPSATSPHWPVSWPRARRRRPTPSAPPSTTP